MREIKFRAFDAATKQHWVPKPQSVIYFDIMHVPDFIINTHNESGEWERRFTVEQFTGMKDKHGIEIYEGDIINWHGFNLEVKFIVDGWFAETSDESITEAGQEWESSCSVIGNIHQHSYLLENNK